MSTKIGGVALKPAPLPNRTLHLADSAVAAEELAVEFLAAGHMVRTYAVADVSGDSEDYRWVVEVYKV